MLIQRYAPLELRCLFVGRRLAECVKSVGHVGVKSVPRSLLTITSCTGRLPAATGPVGPLRDRLYLTQRAIRCALSETGSLPYIHTHAIYILEGVRIADTNQERNVGVVRRRGKVEIGRNPQLRGTKLLRIEREMAFMQMNRQGYTTFII